ncbi:hypothetical protein Syn7502_03612 (plasmid) [Synechococcus sp. PCC 7502]|uniref:hypothetical protein n=1 Tax=Synechococcus sp. PCC 7502 TaxID=1173263 RepID=UPI00029FB0D9|nr:hypothetical protein [Synechococcus sp. PCC 7502]AFY75441.1 hypothetical protein Syn7502_03612 [Synechococcus sp. PCC 7502]
MDIDNILENDQKEYIVLKAVYDHSKPEDWNGISDEDVAKYTGLSLEEATAILTRLLITYHLISHPTLNSGFVSNQATKSKLQEYAMSMKQSLNNSASGVTNNFHGNVGAVQNGDRNIAHVTQNNYSQQSLIDAAKEIQELLDQLAKTYPTNTQTEKLAVVTKAVEQIENSSSWKARIISAIRVGGIEGIKELLDNPLVNIFMAVIEDWQESK